MKNQESKTEYCADVIAFLRDWLVLVSRKSYPSGLALPGGRCEEGESPEDCIVREFKEETGLELRVDYKLGVYDTLGRDPRGHKISTVYVGKVSGGKIRDEEGKTKVVLMSISDLEFNKDQFAFDHFQIINDFLNKEKGRE